jgi:hypothetical protein
MITDVCQRWRAHRSEYRPVGEPFDPAAHEVSEIADDGPAKRFVQEHHYSGSYPAARFRYGLHRRGGELVGVAVFSHPCSDRVLAPLPGQGLERCELGRLVILDGEGLGGNAESWFVARCFERLAAAGIVGVVSFSDPVPRTDADGRRVFRGHYGCVYQALNARFAGHTTVRTLRLMPDGTVLSARTLQKIRARERGWEHAVGQLVRAGADKPRAGQDLADWQKAWVPQVTRVLRHTGNYRYLFGMTRAARRALPESLPYPKIDRGGLR